MRVRLSSAAGAVRGLGARLAFAIAGGVLVLWGAASLIFVLTRVLPGDPAGALLGPNAQVGEDVRQRLRSDLGLDRPVAVQYVDYLGDLARGDLGRSYQLRKPVSEVIAAQLAPTVQLAAAALAIALLLVVVGAVIGRRRGPARSVISTIEQIAIAAPVFWVGLVLLSVFAFSLGWFPVSGARGTGALVLPAVTLAVPTAALVGQVFRDGVEAAERAPFAETVRARGATDTRLLAHHTARHALTGTVPLAAYLVGSLLGGAIVVETVFARPGIGRVTLGAILQRDLPLISGLLLLSTLVFVIVALLADASAALIDPRLRVARRGAR